MNKKLYTGVYLLKNEDNSQFGSMDASYIVDEAIGKATICLKKDNVQKIEIDKDFISIEIDLNQLKIISNISNSVSENIKILKILHKRNKLKDEAYILLED
jgi:hypothetical protein